MRGYKIFGPDYTCREYQYSLDTPNIYSGNIDPCYSGFHFCPVAVNCLKCYDLTPENTYAEVECDDNDDYIVEGDVVCCKELRIVKTLKYEEFRELATGTITTPYLECTYEKGVLNGYKRDYFNRKLSIETPYVDGKIHGTCKYWDGNRKLSIETPYVDGKIHGTCKYWDGNGKLMVESTYVYGKKHGIYKEWHENRILSVETTYVDGKKHGIYREWYVNGKLSLETTYIDDKQHGILKHWYENGKLRLETNYVHGNEHGVHNEWHENGQLSLKTNYVNGKRYETFEM